MGNKNLEQLKTLIKTGAPILLWGAPGIGKTATINALGRELNLPVETVIASIREPSDFAGLPVIKDGGVILQPPAWAKRLAEAGKGILFLDEVSTAPPAVQAALLRVVVERVVGDLPLPKEVITIAAANPPEIAAGGWDLAPPLANRFVHLKFELDPFEWSEEFPGYWGNPPQLPDVIELEWSPKRAIVAAFIRKRPDLLLQLPQGLEQAGLAWPSPRTWDYVSRTLAVASKLDIGLLTDCVGEGAALEFFQWLKALDLPDPEMLLEKPDVFEPPKRGDVLFAILSSVAQAAICNLTLRRWKAAWKIILKATGVAADVAAVAANSLAKARREKPDLPLPVEALEKLRPILEAL